MYSFKHIVRGLANAYRREILRDKPLLEAKRWFADRGDQTWRLDYPLDENSVVLDLGGYVGQWAQDIHDRYGATVHVFEPVPSLYAACQARFDGNAKVHVHGYGLSDKNGTFAVTDDADASSFVSLDKNDKHLMCELRSVAETLDVLGLQRIDLLKINIEGGEYSVLPALLGAGWILRTRFLQIQFHAVGGHQEAREDIRKGFRKSHDMEWCYDFVWEGWTRRD